MRLPRPTSIGAAAIAATLLIAGCGGGGGSGASSGGPASAPAASGGALVSPSNTAALGDFLVGPNGHTLYVFAKDTGPRSSCSGPCARQWPPLISAGRLTAAGGVPASALAMLRRADGTMQVAFKGHPLYYYAGDPTAGDSNGQGLDAFGAKWFAITPAGQPITSLQGPRGGY